MAIPFATYPTTPKVTMPFPTGSGGRSRCFLNARVNPRTMNAMPIPATNSPNSTSTTIPPGLAISCALRDLRGLRRVRLPAERIHEGGQGDADVDHGRAEVLQPVAPFLLRVGVALEERFGDLPDRQCGQAEHDRPQQQHAHRAPSRSAPSRRPDRPHPPPPVTNEMTITPMTMCRMPSTT